MAKIINKAKISSKYSLPDGTQGSNNIESNEAYTENLTTSFLKERESAKQYGIPNQEIEQTLTLTNRTEQPIENVKIMDTIGSGATFKYGSLTIDGVAYPSLEAHSFNLPNSIDIGESVVIKYLIVVDDSPTASTISTISNITYDFVERTGINENSNRVEISVVNNKLEIDKQCNKSAVIVGDRVTYTHIVQNKGNFANTNLFFKDELVNLTFVDESIKIDGISYPTYTPQTGFELKDLNVGDSTTVTFEAVIN